MHESKLCTDDVPLKIRKRDSAVLIDGFLSEVLNLNHIGSKSIGNLSGKVTLYRNLLMKEYRNKPN